MSGLINSRLLVACTDYVCPRYYSIHLSCLRVAHPSTMGRGYQLLKVRQHRDVTIAVLPRSTVLGHDSSHALQDDFQRLASCTSCSILLDLRQVEFIDGSFFFRVLELQKGLLRQSIGFTVLLSPGLAEVARVTKLDQLLDIDRTLDGYMNHSDPLLIGPSPIKLLATGGLGATAGAALVLRGHFGQEWLSSTGWVICAIMALLVCSYCVLALIRRKPSIEINDQGFTAHSLFGRHDRLWSQVEGDFQDIKVGFGRGIGYRLTQDFKDASGIKPSTLFPGNDEAISGAYRMSVRQIVAILNERKQQAVRSSRPESRAGGRADS